LLQRPDPHDPARGANVFVTLGDSVVESERVGEKPMKLELKDGETRFTKGGFAHKAVNLSDKPFVNVTVELKRAIGPDYTKLVTNSGGGMTSTEGCPAYPRRHPPRRHRSIDRGASGA